MSDYILIEFYLHFTMFAAICNHNRAVILSRTMCGCRIPERGGARTVNAQSE